MMHGLEKSDLAIVAVKPANKGARVARGVGGAKGGGQGKHGQPAHAVDSEPRIDVSQQTVECTERRGRKAHCCAVINPRWEPDALIGHVRFCAGGAQ